MARDPHFRRPPHQVLSAAADSGDAFSQEPFEEKVIPGYIDGHNIDFLKNRIAFDLEWNSKDQTFDRDLLAMRTYYDCDLVSAGSHYALCRADDIFKTFNRL